MQKKLQLWCDRWLRQVANALARYENVPSASVDLLLKDKHSLLLLNWKTWMVRYAVPVDFILITLLEYFKKIRRRNPGRITLGVGVPQLTGERAQEIIEAAVAAAFPDNENFAAQRSEITSRIVSRRLQKFPPGLPLSTNLKEYKKTIEQHQQRSRTLPKMYQRSWRGNPFR